MNEIFKLIQNGKLSICQALVKYLKQYIDNCEFDIDIESGINSVYSANEVYIFGMCRDMSIYNESINSTLKELVNDFFDQYGLYKISYNIHALLPDEPLLNIESTYFNIDISIGF